VSRAGQRPVIGDGLCGALAAATPQRSEGLTGREALDGLLGELGELPAKEQSVR
jgi:hypothetical protein